MELLYYLDQRRFADDVIAHDWREGEFRHKVGCTWGCSAVRPEFEPIQINIPFLRDPGLFHEGAPLAGVFRRDLLDLLLPHMTGFRLGEVYWDESGKLFDKYVTLRTMPGHAVFIRTGPEQPLEMCKTCGRVMDRPVHTEVEEYIVRHDIRGRHAVQFGDHGGIAVSETLVNQIDWSKWPDIEMYPYLIRTKPIDGHRYPGDPDWSTIPDDPADPPPDYKIPKSVRRAIKQRYKAR